MACGLALRLLPPCCRKPAAFGLLDTPSSRVADTPKGHKEADNVFYDRIMGVTNSGVGRPFADSPLYVFVYVLSLKKVVLAHR